MFKKVRITTLGKWPLIGFLVALLATPLAMADLSLSDVFEGVLKALEKWGSQDLVQIMDEQADTIVEGLGDRVEESVFRATDAMNQLRRQVYDYTTAQRFELPGGICLTVGLGADARRSINHIPQVIDSVQQSVFRTVMGGGSPSGRLFQRVARHGSQYCSAEDEAQGRCDKVSALANADLSASIALSPLGYSNPQAEAALAFIDNLAASTVPAAPPPELANTPAGRELQAHRMTAAAQKSLAVQSLGAILGERLRVDGVGSDMGVTEASPLELMAHEVDRRFGSEAWAETIGSNTPEANAREQLLMLAWQHKMMLLQYQQASRTEALLAALVLIASDQAAKPVFDELLTALSRGHIK